MCDRKKRKHNAVSDKMSFSFFFVKTVSNVLFSHNKKDFQVFTYTEEGRKQKTFT